MKYEIWVEDEQKWLPLEVKPGPDDTIGQVTLGMNVLAEFEQLGLIRVVEDDEE